MAEDEILILLMIPQGQLGIAGNDLRLSCREWKAIEKHRVILPVGSAPKAMYWEEGALQYKLLYDQNEPYIFKKAMWCLSWTSVLIDEYMVGHWWKWYFCVT